MAFFAVEHNVEAWQIHVFLTKEARDEYVAWRPDNREALGESDALVEAAIGEGLNIMQDRDWRPVV